MKTPQVGIIIAVQNWKSRSEAVGSNQQDIFKDHSPLTWLDTFISKQLPPALIKDENPLFERRLRLLRWPFVSQSVDDRYVVSTKIEKIKTYTLLVGGFLPVVVAFFEACAFIGAPFLIQIAIRAVLVTLAFSLLCDIHYVLAAVNAISAQITSDEWQQLRLTMLTENDILLANYATIQIQVWRTTIIEISTRLALSIGPLAGYGYFVFYRSPAFSFRFWSMIILPLVLVVAYVLEPLWRMRAITLIAMTVTTWLKEYAAALAVTFIVVVLLLLVQSALLIGILQPILRLGAITRYRSQAFSLIVVAQIMGGILVDIGLFVLFKTVQRGTLWLLQRVAFL